MQSYETLEASYTACVYSGGFSLVATLIFAVKMSPVSDTLRGSEL